ncbi:UDP-N-acetylmuramate:L-alanyl-gamma-D-glutamyl-meso-diaminopimelate ligase [Idiomarina sp. HP20-50]|uniref:UDP-N-acetylmuramate:L-alanyl-gamma-D-glutamyl- meso-diaminopimelate ligase n=1 Tax=Idiomarina sp. HP20-50 TaxID=3070813 RepID=UPI00294ACD4D|nr:UDP-N-acetylmuramate:L-alanyl-gamma-D-glutamyl-meso-diaminopimelate ligase [Idiomarina sp. HP20-50]MDV6315551.1 UDP-N-acetylmuramate:L-alanyl-gamma-D-glutamyl-meso-diaminopimelate ligase [Idiomarina sp. HP20-50]
MHIHIVGICGTFMGGVAAIAQQLGHRVTGSDAKVYPPMSTQLESLGIELMQGYSHDNLKPRPDIVIIGNALSRGNDEVEAVLRERIPYVSGAQWLHDNVLTQRWVLAVAGTHGKTTTASMLSWILHENGFDPGFMIGGVPGNFPVSARLTDSNFFVIEADEYDTAFFDKRSKFVHYAPDTLILNNLEFDHADIFPDLAAIQRQFAHLLRVVPDTGQVILPSGDSALEEVLEQGCWSSLVRAGEQGEWQAKLLKADGTEFEVHHQGQWVATVHWDVLGQHNVNNAVMSIIAAAHVGIKAEHSAQALTRFKSPKRRMELLGEHHGVKVFDDFAHHPSAIKTTVSGLRQHQPDNRIIAVLEPRSNTMKMGVHSDNLAEALEDADDIFVLQTEGLKWRLAEKMPNAHVFESTDDLLAGLLTEVNAGDSVLIMSNGSFDGLHQRFLEALRQMDDTGTE